MNNCMSTLSGHVKLDSLNLFKKYKRKSTIIGLHK